MDPELEKHGDPRMRALLDRLWEIHCRKGRDYVPVGSPASNLRVSEKMGIPAWKGVLLRMNDKVTRLNEFARTGFLLNEGVEDSFEDLANYSLLALILFQETTTLRSSAWQPALAAARAAHAVMKEELNLPDPPGSTPPPNPVPGWTPGSNQDIPDGVPLGPDGKSLFDGTYPLPDERRVRICDGGIPNAKEK